MIYKIIIAFLVVALFLTAGHAYEQRRLVCKAVTTAGNATSLLVKARAKLRRSEMERADLYVELGNLYLERAFEKKAEKTARHLIKGR